MEYPFAEIESKWQKYWLKKRVFETNKNKNRYYVLSMFPYPSGELHMGHISNYSIGDAIAKVKLMQGYNVMQPMGYDSFGLPAENFAIKHNSHPKITTEENIKKMKKQFLKMGFGFDWSRELSTCREDYYKWGQWFFKRMYERGLAYKKESLVNWCEDCQTVLANEQVEEGFCWRCDKKVIQKSKEQWFFRITKYAEELLNFNKMKDWPERVKTMQENWIGKSSGTNIRFKFEDSFFEVFTTRPDTLFGVTFIAIPPEHPLISKRNFKGKIKEFCETVMKKNKIERGKTDKKGIFSGLYCINPANQKKIPVWITNYVLMDYGTGVVMGVPAHDKRDYEFAKKYDLPIKVVIKGDNKEVKGAYIDDGIMVNSLQFNGMRNTKCKKQITKWLNEREVGEEKITYRLRDWGISRQRYWGNPIPIIYCKSCGIVVVPDEDLPVYLPYKVPIGRTRQNPLLSATQWINVKCPKCGEDAKRETDTMDTFVDSSWYFARYTDNKNKDIPFDKKAVNNWLPVDQYIGGIEHAVMHLLYARFFTKFLRDIGLVDCDEPFERLLTQGMVIKNGKKMSKSKGNIVNPKDFLDRYGADTIRIFILFSSPPEKDVDWNDAAVGGSFRFLNRIYRLFDENMELLSKKYENKNQKISNLIKNLRYSTHFTIKKAINDIVKKFHFNTAIASVMEHLNNVYSIENSTNLNETEKDIYKESIIVIVWLLYPFAPHLCQEMWERVGKKGLIHQYGIPRYNKRFLEKSFDTYAIQIMGKLRGKLEIDVSLEKEVVIEKAKKIENVKKYLCQKKIIKTIFIPKKLINFVIK